MGISWKHSRNIDHYTVTYSIKKQITDVTQGMFLISLLGHHYVA
jgi:hypothetical protein